MKLIFADGFVNKPTCLDSFVFFGCIHTRNLLSHNIKWAGSSSKNSQIVRSSEQMSAASGSKLSNGLESNFHEKRP